MLDAAHAGLDRDPTTGLTKLSLALMGCKPEMVSFSPEDRAKLGVPPTGDLAMARVFGFISGLTEEKEITDKVTKQIKTTHGIVGQFQGVNLVTGEIFNGGIFYAPSGFHEMMLAAIKPVLDQLSPGNEAEFELEFHAYEADNPRKYSWKCFNRGKPKLVDRLSAMRRRALSDSKHPTHVALLAEQSRQEQPAIAGPTAAGAAAS